MADTKLVDGRSSAAAMRARAEGLIKGAEELEAKENELVELKSSNIKEPNKYCIYSKPNVVKNDETVKPMERYIARQLGAKIGRTGYLQIESNGKTHIKDEDIE